MAKRLDLTTEQGKNTLTERIFPLISRNNIFTRERYLQKLSFLVGMDERVLRSYLPASFSNSRRPQKSSPDKASQTEKVSQPADEPLEQHLLHLLLLYPELRESAKSVSLEILNLTEHREILKAILVHSAEGDNSSYFEGTTAEVVKDLTKKATLSTTMAERQKDLLSLIERLEDRRLLNLKKREVELFTDQQDDATPEEKEAIREQAVRTNEILRERFAERRKAANV